MLSVTYMSMDSERGRRVTDCRDQRTEFDVMALDWQLANARTPSGILLCPYRLLSSDLRDGRAGRPPIYPTMQCQCQNLCTTRPARMPACPSTSSVLSCPTLSDRSCCLFRMQNCDLA